MRLRTARYALALGIRLLGCMVLGLTGPALYADVFDLRLTEVNAIAGQVEVTNFSETTVTTAANLPFSHKTNTSSFVPSGTEFSPGESQAFAVPGLDAASSDLWLYADTNFTNPASVIAGLQWGSSDPGGRTSVAVSAGKWPSTTFFAPAQTDPSLPLRVIKYDEVPTAWALGAPSPDKFFGTGTPVTDPIPASIPLGSIRIALAPIATGMVSPVTVVQPDDGTNRLFIADQVGRIHVHQGGALLPTPLLDVTSRLVTLNTNFDERGLIGLAVHPNFALNPKIYTLTSEPKGAIPADYPSPPATYNHQGVLAEWTIDAINPNVVDVSTRRELFRVDEPQSNHNGGTLQFGPDGMLYLAIGDGGNRDDEGAGHLPDGNGQSLTNPLGKILRFQVDGGPFPNGRYGIPQDNPFVGVPGAVDAIWAYGLRNPYFFSFDMAGTHQLYCGDVGQGRLEEIDIILPGRNYGWRLKEGSYFFDGNTTGPGFVTEIPVKPLPPALEEPIAEYDHDEGISIIGGFIYRGSSFPQLQGSYVFGDFGMNFTSPSGRLFYMNEPLGPGFGYALNAFRLQQDSQLAHFLKGFGQDRAGEIYVCGSRLVGPSGNTGTVFKISPLTAAVGWEIYE